MANKDPYEELTSGNEDISTPSRPPVDLTGQNRLDPTLMQWMYGGYAPSESFTPSPGGSVAPVKPSTLMGQPEYQPNASDGYWNALYPESDKNLKNFLPPAPAPVAPTSPAPVGPKTNALLPPNNDQANMAMLAKLGATGVLPADFWARHPDLAGGVMKVGQMTEEDKANRAAQGLTPDISGKLFTILEPGRQSKIENSLTGLVDQWSAALQKAISGGPGSNTMLAHTSGLVPSLMNSMQAGAKVPAEINNLNATAAAHTATALEGPARIKELESRAGYYSQDRQHGANIGSMVTNIFTHLMTEKSKLQSDPLFQAKPPVEQQMIIDRMDEDARNAISGVHSLMNKPSGGPGGTPMTASQFTSQAHARGFSDDQIKKELAILVTQGKVVNG